MLVLVPYDETDGAACRLTFEDAGQEFYLVCLFAGSGKGRLSRPAAVQFLLYKIHVDGDACWKSVDNTADAFAVRLTEAGQAQDVSE